MVYYIITYINDKIEISFFNSIEDLKNYETNDTTVLIKADNKIETFKITDECIENLKIKEAGFVAEKYFIESCLEFSLIPIKVEQTKESYEKHYKKVFGGEYIKRPDFFIIGKNGFKDFLVEVKARSRKTCDAPFFSIRKSDLNAYRCFQKYSNKKILFAVYTIDENKKVIKDSLAMMPLDYIDPENKNVIDKKKYYEIKRDAFFTGLKFLID